MAIPATQMRPGMIIKHNNELHLVFKVEHRTPGNLRAFIQAKLRNLRTGAMFEHRFRSADPIERVVVDEISMEFLYNDGDDYYFMNPENYEQTAPEARHAGRRGRVPHAQPADQGVSFFDGSAGRHRTAADRRADRGRNRARPEVGDCLLGDQAGQDSKPAWSCRCRRSSTKAKRSAWTPRRRLPLARITFPSGTAPCAACRHPGSSAKLTPHRSLPIMVRHYLIKGRVQGVGFRWYVHREAATLGLRGWVRNTDDGHVEVVAAGDPEVLAELQSVLHRGSRGSRVDAVVEHELADSEAASLGSFEIEGAW